MSATGTSAPRRRGRRPALAPDEERRRILDAGLRVMLEKGYEAATVEEILTEAALSTRAFYRHFASKDDLILALHDEEVERATRHVLRSMAGARTPREAVIAWIEDLLGVVFDPRRATRAQLLRSHAVASARGVAERKRAVSSKLEAPLVETLRQGKANGSLPMADPEADAELIYRMVLSVDASRDRKEVTHQLLRFVLAGLGATPADGRSARRTRKRA